ncbi:MAG: cadmium-translocating P-type ATPase [Candidatus Accumulibacter sp.]|nr:cadmium-translocating P-type ATPase [Accumulibacter sp.]
MEKIFLLKGIDCPCCASKIETEASALAGVSSAAMNLMTGTLTLSLNADCSENIESAVRNIVARYEPDIVVPPQDGMGQESETTRDNDFGKGTLFKLLTGAFVYLLGISLSSLPYFRDLDANIGLSILIIAYVILGGEVVIKMLKNISNGRIFDENFLMSISTIGAFVIGEYSEAVAVMLFYQIGETVQDSAVRRSKKSIASLMDIRPDTATVRRNGELQTVASETVSIGEIIVVKPGEKIPLDGVVLDGNSMLDTKALTGEPMPKTAGKGDTVLSGCINQNGVLTIRVSKAFSESTASKIIDLVKNAASRKAPVENFITVFSGYYTPIVVTLAILLAVLPPLVTGGGWSNWIYRAFVFLVISCPCALVISIPLGFFGGIGGASRKGILVKGGNYLDALGKLDIVVFDKTGTLTKGVFKVTEIIPAIGFSGEKLLEYAAYAESLSNHPIAASIQNAYGQPVARNKLNDYNEKPGYGVSVTIEGHKILAGSGGFMETSGIRFEKNEKMGTKIYVAVDNRFAGCIVIADEIKADSKETISGLKKLGVRKTVMLTGDNAQTGKAVSEELGLDECYAELLPDQKIEKLEILEKQKDPKRKLAFVGDGINDSPVLARADIGIAMGGLGSDAAIEASDVVLMTDEPSRLIDAISIAKATKRIVFQNIICALGIKSAFLVLGAFGIAGMWEAVFADTGVAVFAILNATRIINQDIQ